MSLQDVQFLGIAAIALFAGYIGRKQMEPAGPPPAEFRLRSLEPESRRDITADVDVKLQGLSPSCKWR